MDLKVMGMLTSNFCRVTLVTLAPNGKTVEIHGKNAQGKSSLVNSFWAAIGGPRALTEMGITNPVKKGAEQADIYVDLGDLLVRREFTPDGATKVVVTNKEGHKQEPGQTVLDSLRGKFFDLSAFVRMDGPSKKQMLERMVPLSIDLNDWALKRKAVYDRRTEVNREVSRLTKLLESSPPVDALDEEVSSADILKEMADEQAVKDSIQEQRQALRDYAVTYREAIRDFEALRADDEQLTEKINGLKNQILGLEMAQTELREKAVSQSATIEDMKHKGLEMKTVVEALIDPDMTGFQTRLTEVEQTNIKVRAKKARARLLAELTVQSGDSTDLTNDLATFDKDKDDALNAAEFPVDGLGFDDEGVTFNGQPINQASDMENLYIGYGIGKALNPSLKVMRLSRPGDLDEEHYAGLLSKAEEDGYQLLIEMVGSGDDGVVIVDGCADAGTTPGVEKIIQSKPKKRKAKEEPQEIMDAIRDTDGAIIDNECGDR